MPKSAALAAYVARRDAWLLRTVDFLRADNRFAATWLAGSFGRGDHDEVSDIDPLLRTPVPVWADSTPEHRADQLEATGYFWLMTATACRYLMRQDAPMTVAHLSIIHGVLDGLNFPPARLLPAHA